MTAATSEIAAERQARVWVQFGGYPEAIMSAEEWEVALETGLAPDLLDWPGTGWLVDEMRERGYLYAAQAFPHGGTCTVSFTLLGQAGGVRSDESAPTLREATFLAAEVALQLGKAG